MAFGDLIQSPTATVQTATSVTVTLVTTAISGNLLVCIHFTGASDSTAPTGFTEAVAVTDGGNADQGAIYYKISDGTETAVTPGSGASDENMAQVLEFEGPWDASPLDQTASSAVSTTQNPVSGTTGTTAVADEISVVGITARAGSQVVFSSWLNSYTESADIFTNFKNLGVSWKLLTATGTTSSGATLIASLTAMGMIATFKKEAAGGGIVVLRRRIEGC